MALVRWTAWLGAVGNKVPVRDSVHEAVDACGKGTGGRRHRELRMLKKQARLGGTQPWREAAWAGELPAQAAGELLGRRIALALRIANGLAASGY